MDNFYRYLPLGIFATQMVLGWAFWSFRKEFVSQKYCADCMNNLTGVVSDLKIQTQEIEQNLNSRPNTKNIHELSLQIEKMVGRMSTMAEILERVEQKVERQEDYLLRGKKK